MRDVITIPINGEESLIIASDNSGAIGMKEQDHVHVSYETIAYFPSGSCNGMYRGRRKAIFCGPS